MFFLETSQKEGMVIPSKNECNPHSIPSDMPNDYTLLNQKQERERERESNTITHTTSCNIINLIVRALPGYFFSHNQILSQKKRTIKIDFNKVTSNK